MATFAELTGMEIPTEAQRPLETMHGGGADTRRASAEALARRSAEVGVGGTLKAAWQRNITPMLFDEVSRKFDFEPEDGFDASAWVTENKDTLPGVNLEAFGTVRSTAEAEALRADMIRAESNDRTLQSKGYGGMAAGVLAGFVDPAEMAIALSTGGFGKAGTTGSRLARIGSVTTQGALGATASSIAINAYDPLSNSKQIVFGAMSGALLSGAVGTAFNMRSQGVRRAYSGEVNDLPDATRVVVDAPAFDMQPRRAPSIEENPGSLGAASLAAAVDPANLSKTSREIFTEAQQFVRDNDLAMRFEDSDMDLDTAAGRTAARLSEAVSRVPGLRTDFDKLSGGGSAVEQVLAYRLLESADGRVRNNRSASMLQETYEQRLASHSMPVLEDSFGQWARARNLGLLDRNKPAARNAFDREVIEELEARFHEGAPVSTNPHIKAAADAVDANYADAVNVGKGRAGEMAIDGFEDMQAKSGFFNHKWDGQAMRRLMREQKVTEKQMRELLAQGYRAAYPTMTPDQSSMIAKAVIRRSLAKADGTDTNMLTTMDSDGRAYLRETLTDGGYDAKSIDRLMDTLTGKAEDKGRMGTTKARVQVDLRTSDGQISLMDLVDTSLNRVMSRYNRSVAGNAALARQGITNKAQRKQIIDAAMDERIELGLPAGDEQRKFIEDIFTYFDAGPIAGGVDPMVSRTKRLTNLALLNQMGLTQAGEAGALLAAVGYKRAMRYAAPIVRQMRSQGGDSPILKELRPFLGNVGQEHLLFRDDLMLDELADAAAVSDFMRKFDFTAAKAQRAQGYLSGFYYVRSMQQRIAVASMADKVIDSLRKGADVQQLRDLGVDPKIKKYIDNGTVTFTPEGAVDRLNLDQWNPMDAENFALSLNRGTHQVVQKVMAGESSVWMHKGAAPLFVHLKSFPILAMRKQALRNVGVSTPLAVATLAMGLATAGLAYEAKQIVNGRTDRVSAEDFIKGGFGMSNMTGWFPMLSDPAAAILGLNDLRFNQYGRHDVSTGVLPIPPAIPTLNRMAQLPGAFNPASDLSDNERIRIMQATPVVGNLYGFTAIFNAMKE